VTVTEIAPHVYEIPLVRVKVHALVDGEDVTLIDAGHPTSPRPIQRALASIGIDLDGVTRIVCTHGHPDHAGGARALAERGIEVLIHPDDAANLRLGYRDAARRPSLGRVFAAMTPSLGTYTPMVDGDVLPVLGGLEVVHTPGHTPGSVCLYARRDGLLFVGDMLQRRFGRVSFASGLYSDDPRMARMSVQRLARLDVKTIVFSHFPPLTENAAETLATLATIADRAGQPAGR
jgi:glyoxylase-like metal-dependent hydrolase (beta-lactamase superfamily II)